MPTVAAPAEGASSSPEAAAAGTLEAAGTVDAVGPDVRGLEPGTRVVALLSNQGGFAERAVAPASTVLPLPDGVSFEQAICLPAQAPTALLGLREGAKLREGGPSARPSPGSSAACTTPSSSTPSREPARAYRHPHVSVSLKLQHPDFPCTRDAFLD
ncbi:alcohol dehydrogenase catalytic domain-containing protein [Archangium lansingense]|uniref:alcohol dehydrogenase catalytic domain-containing protein n=1 Tax=Archangium lansingense TaxID=2995310 RepID=UPI003B7CACCD